MLDHLIWIESPEFLRIVGVIKIETLLDWIDGVIMKRKIMRKMMVSGIMIVDR